MINQQKQVSPSENFANLQQKDSHFNSKDAGHSSLASLIPPRPSHLPLGGPRIIEFLGFRTGKNQFGRNTVSLDFVDTVSLQIISRTVNIDPTFSDRSYFVKFITQLVGDSQKFKEAAAGGGDALGALINEQKGKRFTADCEPSKTGMHTNIIDFRPLEAPKLATTGRAGSKISIPMG